MSGRGGRLHLRGADFRGHARGRENLGRRVAQNSVAPLKRGIADYFAVVSHQEKGSARNFSGPGETGRGRRISRNAAG